MNRAELLEFHKELCAKAHALMVRKNHDYAGRSGDDPFTNFRRSELLGICSTEAGFLVRFTDKLSRLITFVESGQLLVKDEAVEDSCIDLLNYSVLFAALVKEKKEKIDKADNSGQPSSDRS